MTIRNTLTKSSSRHDAVLPTMPMAVSTPATSTVAPHTFTDRLLRLPEVARTIGVSRATIYRYVDSGRLPRPVKVSTRCIAWRASEITAWMAALEAV
jgi:prophage regulatory protein